MRRSTNEKPNDGLWVVALFEAAKGVIIFVAGFGLLSLINNDAQAMAEEFVQHMHLNPASHYPKIFIDLVAHASNQRLWLLASMATLYALVRWVEAYGLWHRRTWAEWFAAISGAVYVPLEIYELFRGVSVLKLFTLGVNVAIVLYMIVVLWRAGRR